MKLRAHEGHEFNCIHPHAACCRAKRGLGPATRCTKKLAWRSAPGLPGLTLQAPNTPHPALSPLHPAHTAVPTRAASKGGAKFRAPHMTSGCTAPAPRNRTKTSTPPNQECAWCHAPGTMPTTRFVGKGWAWRCAPGLAGPHNNHNTTTLLHKNDPTTAALHPFPTPQAHSCPPPPLKMSSDASNNSPQVRRTRPGAARQAYSARTPPA